MTRRWRMPVVVVVATLVVSFAVLMFLGSQVPKRFGGVGAWIPWYCWDNGEPRPHTEDAKYLDHPCTEDELPPVARGSR